MMSNAVVNRKVVGRVHERGGRLVVERIPFNLCVRRIEGGLSVLVAVAVAFAV